MAAYLALAQKRRARERAEDLVLGILASRGDKKGIEKQLKEWEREAN